MGTPRWLTKSCRVPNLLWLGVVLALSMSVVGPIGAQQAEPIALGFIGVMSGANALNGELNSRGAILAVEQINAAGGVNVGGARRPLRLVVEDDRGTPPGAVNAANKLIQQDRAFAILGPDFSNNVLATLPITKSHGVLQIYSTISSATVDPSVRSEFAFRTRAQDTYWGRAAADYIIRQLGRNRRIGASHATIEFGITGANSVEIELKKIGLSYVERVSHNAGDQDLTASAAALIRARADVVVAWTLQAQGVLLLRSLKSLGWNGKFIYATPDPFFVGIGGNTVEGVVGPQNWAFTDPSPKSASFTTGYVTRFGGQFPSSHTAGYYDAVYLLKEAIERVGLNARAVRDYMLGLKSWEGVQGIFRPSQLSNGNLVAVVVMVEIRNGQPIILKRYDYTAAK